MTATAPEPLNFNPVLRVGRDLRDEWRERGGFPPGPRGFSVSRTRALVHEPVPMLLGLYEEYGPVFSVRVFHGRQVFMLGPEANHYMLVSHADNFHWREGNFGDLVPLMGDGLLTIDGDYHRRARRIMLPAFHHAQIDASVDAMRAETERALAGWREGEVVDIYHWARELAMRIAMRALLGLDPDDGGTGAKAAVHFERALGWFGTDFYVRVLQGPGTPWAKMHSSRKVLDGIIFAEIDRRREHPDPERRDILSLLLEAEDEDGSKLSDQEVRDQVITLMFAGHDTSTSTISFLLYELVRDPEAFGRLLAEQDAVLGGDAPEAAELVGGLPYLDMVLDETLRMYPPAWVGPRRSVEAYEFAGVNVPGNAYVNYSSWASHMIPGVFPDPEAFIPERFAPEAKKALPKGAYVPFGGGSRTCIGMRFGQMEIKVVTTMLLQRFGLELVPGKPMQVRQMPTLGPKGGLRMRIGERGLPQDETLAA